MPVDQYLDLRASGQLYADIDDGTTHYGYLKSKPDERVRLMYASPFQVDNLNKESKLILVEREDIEISDIRDESRVKLNIILQSQFYSHIDFRRKMHLIVDNNKSVSETTGNIIKFIQNHLTSIL
jgi:hypothetical protein